MKKLLTLLLVGAFLATTVRAEESSLPITEGERTRVMKEFRLDFGKRRIGKSMVAKWGLPEKNSWGYVALCLDQKVFLGTYVKGRVVGWFGLNQAIMTTYDDRLSMQECDKPNWTRLSYIAFDEGVAVPLLRKPWKFCIESKVFYTYSGANATFDEQVQVIQSFVKGRAEEC